DPGGQILMNLYPLPNRDPNFNDRFNYVSDIVNPQHRTQQRLRGDYNISDNTKLYTVFNHEDETFPFPYIAWRGGPRPTAVTYPTPSTGNSCAFSSSTSLVNRWTAPLTNKIISGATSHSPPTTIAERKKVSRSARG